MLLANTRLGLRGVGRIAQRLHLAHDLGHAGIDALQQLLLRAGFAEGLAHGRLFLVAG